MVDLVLATIGFVLAVVLLVGLLVGLVVVPFGVAVTMAERRGFATARWGALALEASAFALLLVGLLHRGTDVHLALIALPLLPLTWGGPAVLWLLDGSEEQLGGRAGRHE